MTSTRLLVQLGSNLLLTLQHNPRADSTAMSALAVFCDASTFWCKNLEYSKIYRIFAA